MKTNIGPHELTIQDSGAPRGEKNHWTVTLNGIELYADYNGRKAERLHHAIELALREKHPK